MFILFLCLLIWQGLQRVLPLSIANLSSGYFANSCIWSASILPPFLKHHIQVQLSRLSTASLHSRYSIDFLICSFRDDNPPFHPLCFSFLLPNFFLISNGYVFPRVCLFPFILSDVFLFCSSVLCCNPFLPLFQGILPLSFNTCSFDNGIPFFFKLCLFFVSSETKCPLRASLLCL